MAAQATSKVRNACEELARSSRACRERMKDELMNGVVSSPLALIREKEVLTKECFKANVELEFRQQLAAEPLDAGYSMNTTDAEMNIQSRLRELNQEVQSLAMERNLSSQLLDCLQKSQLLVKLLFQHRSASFSSVPQDRVLCPLLLEQQTKLVMDILKDIQAVQQLRLQLEETRSQRMVAVQENRQLMHNIQSRKVKSHKDVDKDQQETSALVFEEAKVCLLTHVLQCLVFASGVDWAQDKELLKLILTLGHILAVTLNNSL